MKIIFISDIHGHIENLKKISFDCDKLVVLGDLFGYSYENNDFVFNFLKNNQDRLILLKGNCDSDESLRLLGLNYYDYYDLNVDDIVIRCTHGNKDYSGNFDVLIFGHKHYPFIQKEGRITKICVGSIENPRNNSNYSYCIYENRCFKLIDINENVLEEITL